MGKTFKIGTLTIEDQRKMERSVRRSVDIELDTPHFKHKVHKTAKNYNRAEAKRTKWFYEED